MQILQQYRKIPNISPGLTEVRKHFLVGLHSEDLYTEGPIFGRTFGLKGDLCMPKKFSSRCPVRETNNNI